LDLVWILPSYFWQETLCTIWFFEKAGADVKILKRFTTKKLEKKIGVFLFKLMLVFLQKFDHNIGLKKKRHFFRRK
jgi:hypothetical protein